jgi:hypothetical protein
MKFIEYKDFSKFLGLSTRYLSTYKSRGQIIVVDGMVDLDNEINKKFVDNRINPQPKVSWYERNREKVIEKSKEWHRKNPERAKQSRKKYDEKNKKPRKIPQYLHCPSCKKIKNNEDYSVKMILVHTVCDDCKLQKKNESRERRLQKQRERNRNLEKNKRYKKARVESGRAAEYERNKRASDPLYKFKGSVRTCIYYSITKKGYKKSKKTEEILGCTLEYFKKHIESQFLEGMSFENHGEWHIDHIVPLASAKTEEEVVRLNHYSNLRPLWALDNLRKGSKEI